MPSLPLPSQDILLGNAAAAILLGNAVIAAAFSDIHLGNAVNAAAAISLYIYINPLATNGESTRHFLKNKNKILLNFLFKKKNILLVQNKITK